MSYSDWTGLIGFVALILSPIAFIWWRFGDPDRDDRISATPTSAWGLPALLFAASGIRAMQKGDWIAAAIFIGLAAIASVQWRRDRLKAETIS